MGMSQLNVTRIYRFLPFATARPYPGTIMTGVDETKKTVEDNATKSLVMA
jgi:hypothetical protein